MATPPPPPPPPRPPVSVLAVLGAFSLIVPLIGPLAAVLLAGFALLRIRNASGKLRGRRLALCTLLCAGVLLVAQSWVIETFVRRAARVFEDDRDAAITTVFAAHDAESSMKALGQWSGHAAERTSPESILAFAMSARARYGAFDHVSPVAPDAGQSAIPGRLLTVPVVFRFERGDCLGTLTMRVEQSTDAFRSVPRIAMIAIEDREVGNLHIGSALPDDAAPPSATTTPTTKEASSAR